MQASSSPVDFLGTAMSYGGEPRLCGGQHIRFAALISWNQISRKRQCSTVVGVAMRSYICVNLYVSARQRTLPLVAKQCHLDASNSRPTADAECFGLASPLLTGMHVQLFFKMGTTAKTCTDVSTALRKTALTWPLVSENTISDARQDMPVTLHAWQWEWKCTSYILSMIEHTAFEHPDF